MKRYRVILQRAAPASGGGIWHRNPPTRGTAQTDWRNQMKAIEINMPDEVYKKLENLASQDHQSVNAFALRKLEEFTHVFEDFEKLERRAQHGNREEFVTSMAKVPNAPPVPGDEM
jgi:predicted DNA-binding protein